MRTTKLHAEQVERLAERLFVLWHPANTVEHWRNPDRFIDRPRFRTLAAGAIEHVLKEGGPRWPAKGGNG